MHPIKEKCVIHFKLSVDFRGCDYSKEMTVQPMMLWLSIESKYAHLTSNAKCDFVFKCENGVCHYMRCIFFLQMTMQPFLYEMITITLVSKPNASTMQVQNAKMHKHAKNKIFLYFLK